MEDAILPISNLRPRVQGMLDSLYSLPRVVWERLPAEMCQALAAWESNRRFPPHSAVFQAARKRLAARTLSAKELGTGKHFEKLQWWKIIKDMERRLQNGEHIPVPIWSGSYKSKCSQI